MQRKKIRETIYDNVQSLAKWRYSVIRQPGLLLLIKDKKLMLYSKVHLCYGKLELKPSSEPDDETLDPQAAILPNSLFKQHLR